MLVDDFPVAAVERAEEAALVAFVADAGTLRVDREQHRVAVAVGVRVFVGVAVFEGVALAVAGSASVNVRNAKSRTVDVAFDSPSG